MSVVGPGSPSSSSFRLSLIALITLTLFTFAEAGCAGGTKASGSSGSGGSGGGTGGGGNNNPSAQQFVYVANGGNNTSAYVLGSNGSLTAVSGSPFSVGGSSVAADPNGKFLFSLAGLTSPSTTAVNTDTISSSGALAVSSSLSDATFAGPVQINPNGNTLYVSSVSASQDNPGWKIYSIQSDGSLQFSTAAINQNAGRFTFLSDGSYAYAAFCYHLAADIQGFNTANGGITAVNNNVPNPGAFGECPNTVAVTPSGSILAAAWSDADNVGPIDNLITIYNVTSSHSLSVIGTSFPASGAGVDSVFDPSGKFFIVAQDNGIGVYQVGPNSATEVAGSPFANGTNFTRLALSPSGGFVIAISPQSQQIFVFSLNSSTGALTPASGSPQSVTTPADLAIAQQ